MQRERKGWLKDLRAHCTWVDLWKKMQSQNGHNGANLVDMLKFFLFAGCDCLIKRIHTVVCLHTLVHLLENNNGAKVPTTSYSSSWFEMVPPQCQWPNAHLLAVNYQNL